MSLKLLDTDKGWKELKKTLKTLASRKSYVKAGVIGAEAEEEHDVAARGGDLTNAELAAVMEFGSPFKGIPSRPFIGGTFELNKEKYKTQLAKGLKRVYENKLAVPQLLGLLGVSMVKDIKDAVLNDAVWFAPNAPDTIARKGSDRPLVDHNKLVASVQHEVVE